jgi:hypothetical protein
MERLAGEVASKETRFCTQKYVATFIQIFLPNSTPFWSPCLGLMRLNMTKFVYPNQRQRQFFTK